MRVTDFISADGIAPELRATSKKQVLGEISRLAAKLTGVPRQEIFDALTTREQLGPTITGGGTALPHAQLAGIDRLYGIIARLDQKIDFDSLDRQPVDLLFVLLAPEAAPANHLKALTRMARLARDPAVVKNLRNAGDAVDIMALLEKSKTAKAA